MAKEKNTKKNKKVINDIKLSNKKNVINKARRDLHFEGSDGADEISKLIKVILIVTAVMIVFYVITTVVTRKANAIRTVRNSKTEEKADIQYDNLIIGTMLNIDGSYYVLILNSDDENASEYQMLINTVLANDEAPKIYTAKLDDGFNKRYLGSENNYDSDLTNFKVKGTALIKVNDHKIEDTFDTYDSITGELNNLK